MHRDVCRGHEVLEAVVRARDLDRGLSIKRYTPPLRDLFNVKKQDLGRPIGDLTHSLRDADLEKDAARVLADLAPIERSVQTREGATLTVRIRPYRTAEDKIDGVVVTFMKDAERSVARNL